VADTLRLEVPEALSGTRLDKALATLLDISRAEARVMVESGVLVGGTAGKPSDRVDAGSVIETPPPSLRRALAPEDIQFEVVMEDSHLIVVDKPAGIVVHPGAGHARGTLAAGLLSRFPEIEGVGHEGRWGLIHRLDKETSGVLLVARTQMAFDFLSSEMRGRRVQRVYDALVDGLFSIPTGTVEAPIGRDPAQPTRRAVVPYGKPATTHYEVVRSFAHSSLLEVRLETGRTHQIRVHLAAIDHPLIGDRLYGSRAAAAKSPRVFLHARRIEFTHPEEKTAVSAEAPLPEDLSRVLAGL
jgi:23S rRNA pseudouridine1911/1915/1917 synthase